MKALVPDWYPNAHLKWSAQMECDSTSKCLIKASLSFRASVCTRPLQHIQMTVRFCISADLRIPPAAVFSRPLQHFQVTGLCRKSAGIRIPLAAVRSRPLQQLQVTFPCRMRARLRGPRAALRTCPLQHLQVERSLCTQLQEDVRCPGGCLSTAQRY